MPSQPTIKKAMAGGGFAAYSSAKRKAFDLAGFVPLTAAVPQSLKECLDAKGIILRGKNGILSHRSLVRRKGDS